MWMNDWRGSESSKELVSFESHLAKIGKLLGISLPLNKYFLRDGDSALMLVFREHDAPHNTSIRVRLILSRSVVSAVNLEIDGRREVVNGEIGKEVALISQGFFENRDLIKQVIEHRDNTVYED